MKKGLLYICMALLFVGCGTKAQDTIVTVSIERLTHHATLTAVGDLMFHEHQLARSYDKATGSFSFEDTFTQVIPYLTVADLTVGNLETTIAGKNNALSMGEAPVAGYSGYPCFNTPDEVVGTLKNAGFDMLTTANNHALDSGIKGLKRTLEILDSNGILHIGTYSNIQEAQDIQLVEIDTMTFAFIGMTYSTNGFQIPKDAPYCIHCFDEYSRQKAAQMCQLVRDARALNPDFVVVMPHFGLEYQEYEDPYQSELVSALFKAGADVVLGSHPHVLDPIDIMEVNREDGTFAKGFVVYSMGNFISSQKEEGGIPKDLGVIITLDFEKVGTEKAALTGFSMVPTYTYWTEETIGVLPVDETLEKIESGDLIMPAYDVRRLQTAKEYSVDHLMTYLTDYTVEFKDHRYYVGLE